MDFDFDGLFNVHTLQHSQSTEDQKRLVELVQRLSTADGWQLCASVLTGDSSVIPPLDSLPEAQRTAISFLCCRVMEEFLKSNAVVQNDEAQLFSAFIWKWWRQLIHPEPPNYPKYITSKASQLACLAIVRYYPKFWPTAFHELLSLMTDRSEKSTCFTLSMTESFLNATTMFLDTLMNLDPFLVSRDVQLTTEELVRANEIKDYMRETCIADMMNFCYHLAHSFGSQLSYASHLKKLLVTVGLMASWVDLSLVGNSGWISLLFNLLQASLEEPAVGAVIRCGVYSYLIGLTTKGLPATDKINLINAVWDQLGQLLLADPLVVQLLRSDVDNSTAYDENALFSLRTFATLVDSCGLQLTDAYRKISGFECDGDTTTRAFNESSQENISLRASTLEKIENNFNLALHVFGHADEQVSQSVIPFLRSYVALVRGTGQSTVVSQGRRRPRNRNSSTSMDSPSSTSTSVGTSFVRSSGLVDLNHSRLFLLKRLLFAVVSKMKTLPLQDEDNNEEEDSYNYRHDLRTLVSNLIQLDAGCVLEVIDQLIKHAEQLLKSSVNANQSSFAIETLGLSDIDVALSLFYLFGESCKAPKNDHFSPQFYLSASMKSIMDTLCSDSFSDFPHWVLQLQYFELMARYDKYFHEAPEQLFKVMVAFLDQRGLRSPWRSVRVRCAYLITPIIKSHRKTLVPYTEQLLAQFADLLQIPLEPESLADTSHHSTDKVNGSMKPNPVGPLLGITETSFLYEAAAQLIAAGGSVSTAPPSNSIGSMEDRVGHLFRMLIGPVFVQYNQLINYYVSEVNENLAEARGRLLKQAADLITRTSRVFSQPKSVMTPGCQTVFCEALQLMLNGLSRFPCESGAPGRAAACAGVRAFLHRMVACLGPVSSVDQTFKTDDVSEILLTALIQAVPQLVRPLQLNQNLNGWVNGSLLTDVANAEQRWRELRDVIPLITQVISRYKDRSTTFLAACLPGLVTAILTALAEPVSSDHLSLIEERRLLRRCYLQLLLCIVQSLPQAFFELLSASDAQPLSTILSQIEACIDTDDPLGLRSGLLLFLELIQSNAKDSQFYQNFLLPHLVPFCVLAPTRSTFRLADAQFGLALNEIGNCLATIAKVQPEFCTYLQDVFLPEQQLSRDLIQSYVGTLQTQNAKDLHLFFRTFYAAFR